MLEDEAAYSCEITYEEPGRWFKDSCQDPQLTLLNVLGKPDDVIVTMENGTELEDGYILGPYTEGSNLLLRCHAEGGRPIPEVRANFHFWISKLFQISGRVLLKVLAFFKISFSN